jgi:drug/metabolite transporter (DMT)-like permease
LSGSVPPLLLAGFLYLGSGIGLALVLAGRAMSAARTKISWPRGLEILWLLAAIALGGAIAPYLLMYGLQSVDSATASLTLNLEGVFTALLAWVAFRENVDRRILLGMACIVAGGVLLSLGPAARGDATGHRQ